MKSSVGVLFGILLVWGVGVFCARVECQEWDPVVGGIAGGETKPGKVIAKCGDYTGGPWYDWYAIHAGSQQKPARVFFWGDESELGNVPVTSRRWQFPWGQQNVTKDEKVPADVWGTGTIEATYTVTVRGKEYSDTCKVTMLEVVANPTNIWYFGGEKPANYPTEMTWTADGGAAGGYYEWKVEEGAGIVEFGNGQAESTSTASSVLIRSISYSQEQNDVQISLWYYSEGCYRSHIATWSVEVSSPLVEIAAPATDVPWQISGFWTTYFLRVVDKVGAATMPFQLEVNEQFTTWNPDPPPWGVPVEASLWTRTEGGVQRFEDNYAKWWTFPPTTVQPGWPGTWEPVQETWQNYYGGSLAIGAGQRMNGHHLRYCRGVAYWWF